MDVTGAEQAEIAVRRGIELLDLENPRWRAKVNCRTLDLASTGHCILGQVYGSYHQGRYELTYPDSEACGFATLDDWDELQRAWKRALGCDLETESLWPNGDTYQENYAAYLAQGEEESDDAEPGDS